ncbi:hypothetical protein LINGRAHAP2_LOCUS19513, partial [Linum grandiflorum]
SHNWEKKERKTQKKKKRKSCRFSLFSRAVQIRRLLKWQTKSVFAQIWTACSWFRRLHSDRWDRRFEFWFIGDLCWKLVDIICFFLRS